MNNIYTPLIGITYGFNSSNLGWGSIDAHLEGLSAQERVNLVNSDVKQRSGMRRKGYNVSSINSVLR